MPDENDEKKIGMSREPEAAEPPPFKPLFPLDFGNPPPFPRIFKEGDEDDASGYLRPPMLGIQGALGASPFGRFLGGLLGDTHTEPHEDGSFTHIFGADYSIDDAMNSSGVFIIYEGSGALGERIILRLERESGIERIKREIESGRIYLPPDKDEPRLAFVDESARFNVRDWRRAKKYFDRLKDEGKMRTTAPRRSFPRRALAFIRRFMRL